MPDGFRAPEFAGELLLEKRLAGLPPTGRVKGMFLRGVADYAEREGITLSRPAYQVFKDYPLSEYLSLLAEAAVAVHPDLEPLASLRKIGHTVYPTFVSSTIGKVTMAVAGRSMRSAISLTPRAYAVAGNTTRIDVVGLTNRSARLRLKNVWDWPGAYHVGIMEGAFEAFAVDGEVRVKEHSLAEVELKLEWRSR